MDYSEEVKASALRLFDYLGKNPNTWAISAERLKLSADILRRSEWPDPPNVHKDTYVYPNFMIGPVYMMLFGFATECLLKAMYVAKFSKEWQKGKLPKALKTHDLNKLWSEVGLRKCDQYIALLETLGNYTVTFGRYPITLKKEQMETIYGASFSPIKFTSTERLWVFLVKHAKALGVDIQCD